MFCPQCHTENADKALFCEECGAPLNQDNSSSRSFDTIIPETMSTSRPAPAMPPLPSPEPNGAKPPFTPKKRDDTVNMGYPEDWQKHQNGKIRLDIDTNPTDEGTQEKFDIEVDYTTDLHILAGGTVNFEIRVWGRSKPLHEVRVWQLINDQPGKKAEEFTLEEQKQGIMFSGYIPCTAPADALGNWVIYYNLLCRFKDEIQFFRFHVQHAIDVPKSGEKYYNIFDIKTEGSSKTVFDFENAAVGGKPFGQEQGYPSNASGMTTPKYKKVSLEETSWRPEFFWQQGGRDGQYRCDQLTLRYKEMIIHLCALPSIKVGRRSDMNDIAINDWRNRESFFGLPSQTVSKNHGFFTYRRDSVVYEDQSSYGSQITINGEEEMFLHKGEEEYPYKAKLPESGSLSLGNIKLDFKLLRCYERLPNRMCTACDRCTCRAMFLQRRDGLPELFLFLWQCCELEQLLPELEGFTIYRRNGGFLLEMPNGQLVSLCPNRHIPIGNDKRLKVERFSQKEF